jgi:DNA-binding response OmpR family regulator
VSATFVATGRPATPAELRRAITPDYPVLLVGPSATWESNGVAAWLNDHGWSSRCADDSERARWLASIQKVSLVLVSGPAPMVRSVVEGTRPVTMAPLVVLADPSPREVVALLGAGVDAVVSVVGGVDEVFARVVALLRRCDYGWDAAVRYLTADGLEVDVWTQECHLAGERIHLSPTEYALLVFLMTHPQQALPINTIVRRVWNGLPNDGKNTLRIFVNRLRRKLGDDRSKRHFIASIRGTGYRFLPNVVQMSDAATDGLVDVDIAKLIHSLDDLAAGLNRVPSVAAAADLLADSLQASGYADGMAVFRSDGRSLRLVTAREMPGRWLESVAGGVPLTGSFASAHSVLRREPVQLGDIAAARHFAATASRLADTGYHACLFLPILCGDSVWGHLGLVRRSRQPFDATGSAYLRASCAVFALAVDDDRILKADGR